MRYTDKIHHKKLAKILYCLILYFMIITARLIQLQIIQFQRFAKFGEKNFLRFKTIPAQRGSILDCNGTALATNSPVLQLVWKGSGLTTFTNDQKKSLLKIQEILSTKEKPWEIPWAKLKRAEKFSTELQLSSSINQEQLYIIAEQCSDTENVTFTSTFERIYPLGSCACHVLGYLGDMSIAYSGKMGIEKLFEQQLCGQPQIIMQSINSFGSTLSSKQISPGSGGLDIITSIDLHLQKIAEDAMESQVTGSLILMDPKTGLIKALVSKPNFDPSIFSKKITSEQWLEMQNQKIFLNRAFNATYPPASVFKLVTIACALEEKIISQDSTFICNGYTTFKDRKYYCSNHHGHGKITTAQALAFSCNIPFFEIATKLHIDTLACYANQFGLGNKTNVPFTEKFGLVPTNDWKMSTKGERWWMGETLSASIGQSFLLVTPIQVACMIGSIFQGYLVRPRIIVSDPIEKLPIHLHMQTRVFLQECMQAAVTAGTGRRVNKIGNLTIFAKTGTAQTTTRLNIADPDQNSSQTLHKPHAWFVCYFYTDKTEPLVLVMLLENVGKSTHAVSAAYHFLSNYWKKLK